MINYYLAKKIDRFLSLRLFAIFFIAINKLVSKFTRKISLQSVDTLYVTKLLGGGSLCILIPYLAELKDENNIRIVLVSSRVCTTFSDELEMFDESIKLDTLKGSIRFICLAFVNIYKRMLGKNRSISINFEFHSAISAYVSSFTFAPFNWGVMNNFSQSFSKIYDGTVFYNGHSNVGDVYYKLIKDSFGCGSLLPINKETSAISRYVKKIEKNIVLEDFGIYDEYIAISPFSSGLSRERELSHQQLFAVLAKLNPNNLGIFILGSAADQLNANKFIRNFNLNHFNHKIISLCGNLSISASAKVARSASVYITIDSGLNHYVRMTEAKLIHSYWGPTNPFLMLDQSFYFGKEMIHYKKIYCSPCVHIIDKPPCNGKNICIEGLFGNGK